MRERTAKTTAQAMKTKATFVLGPAGSGKTHHCIQSVRDRLAQAPEGAPLLFLSPKQATFQVESQVLADHPVISGYTRLQILSFPRLAEYILSKLLPEQSQILSENGRIMVLRSLLHQHAKELQAFHSIAAYPAFAQEMAKLLQKLGRHQISSTELDELKKNTSFTVGLKNKLHDLSLIFSYYRKWLEQHKIKDTELLLERATKQLRSLPPEQTHGPSFYIEELWLDGFAEMTPQELALLTAVVQRSQKANLAFCLDPVERKNPNPSCLNPWSTISETYHRCRNQIDELPNVCTDEMCLPRKPEHSRFAKSQQLQHLEEHWVAPQPLKNSPTNGDVSITGCSDREAEVVHAARTILRSVRDRGIRFRQITVIVRHLEDYAAEIKRLFNRYQIPYFIDQRDTIQHHPATVLTQSALKVIARNWKNTDWFAALKTQLINKDMEQVNKLENAALKYGIEQDQWRQPFTSQHPDLKPFESFRKEIIAPFEILESELGLKERDPQQDVSGSTLAKAIKRFWKKINLAKKLKTWERETAAETTDGTQQQRLSHEAAGQQLEAWLENIQLAFAETDNSLQDWLPILETDLSYLSVGAIPPTAEQVLVGAIDRTRNPDVDLAIVLGLNESVFPAPPQRHPLLTETDWEQLKQAGVDLMPSAKRRFAHECFYAYIACTRARQKLTISYAKQDPDGRPLNPSQIISHVQQRFPKGGREEGGSAINSHIQIDQFKPPPPDQAEHASELIAPIFRSLAKGEVNSWEQRLFNKLHPEAPIQPPSNKPGTIRLLPTVAEILYTDADNTLSSSASALEQFAACPFRFFVHSGLKAKERPQFQLDSKISGSFQHEVLAIFHKETQNQDRQWRDFKPGEARDLIKEIIETTAETFHHGIFQKTEKARFSLKSISERLQTFIEVLIKWMPQYEFDPKAAELAFVPQQPQKPIGPWCMDLDNSARLALKGKIDRLDILPQAGNKTAAAVIIDYKSSGEKPDPNGIQLQLFAYLTVVARLTEIGEHLKTGPLTPAGAFYVPLKIQRPQKSQNRDDALTKHRKGNPKRFQHRGRFDKAYLRRLDNRDDQSSGDQFSYEFNKDGTLKKTARQDAMSTEEFHQDIIDRTEENIRDMGNRILKGDIDVDPYEHPKKNPCRYCPYASICRIDPETHTYRILPRPPSSARKSTPA
ncbi:MAG: ATP-dependent helicase/deoxyribonuclease subunit B [Verrucomicrobia subdivision 3 bacterium]|nr:ATP-dependent helicase/deoxyribonuclease subunit B [Limisphaerales bacterium]MCS1416385.1 ATP-dependent helicase/deoxyribonuclease subunit B [Limisphaerales bacterium]